MKRFKPWLVLMLVFAAGMVVGIVGTRIGVRLYLLRMLRNPVLVRERIERDLVKRLQLTPEQQPKVHQILVDSQGRIRDLRREFQPQFAAILKDAQDQIDAQLTPEQRLRFEKYRERNGRFLQQQQPGGP